MQAREAAGASAAGRLDEADPHERARLVAGLGALVAGVLHLLLAPHHLGEAVWLGVGFLVVGVAQCGLAATIGLLQRTVALAAVVVAHLGLLAAYVLTRTVEVAVMPPHDVGHAVDHLPVRGGLGEGVPLLPGSRVEPVAPLDLVVLAGEVVVVLALLTMLPARARGWCTWVAVLLALALVGARVVSGP